MYTKDLPFSAILKARKSLSGSNSTKETLHIVLDLKGEALPYKTGDSVAVIPINDESLVEKTLAAAHLIGDEEVVDKRSGLQFSLREALTSKKSLTNFSKKFLLDTLAASQEETDDPKALMETYEVWDLLEAYPAARFSAQELYNGLMPLLPRFYSIASSSLLYPHEIHLTVAYLKYAAGEKERVGVCTHFLSKLTEIGQEIPLYIQPSHGFTLTPDNDAPIIMIGPGTGVAPFRAFMQERETLSASGKNWLFFGERTKKDEFFYEEDWGRWIDAGKLELSTAFSRDQQEKIYVQDRLKERGKEVAAWIKEGAYLYVCGDKERMARDVETTLLEIIREHLSDTPEEYLKELRAKGRYLKDVY